MRTVTQQEYTDAMRNAMNWMGAIFIALTLTAGGCTAIGLSKDTNPHVQATTDSIFVESQRYWSDEAPAAPARVEPDRKPPSLTAIIMGKVMEACLKDGNFYILDGGTRRRFACLEIGVKSDLNFSELKEKYAPQPPPPPEPQPLEFSLERP